MNVRNIEIRFTVGESALGSVLVAQSDRGICAILLRAVQLPGSAAGDR